MHILPILIMFVLSKEVLKEKGTVGCPICHSLVCHIFYGHWWASEIAERKTIKRWPGHYCFLGHHCLLIGWLEHQHLVLLKQVLVWIESLASWVCQHLTYADTNATYLPCICFESCCMPTHVGPLEFCAHGALWTRYENGAAKKRGHIFWVYFLCSRAYFIVQLDFTYKTQVQR